MSGALKTGSVFDCGKIPASRSYAAGGAMYLRTDLARPDAFGGGQRVEISLEYKAPVSA